MPKQNDEKELVEEIARQFDESLSVVSTHPIMAQRSRGFILRQLIRRAIVRIGEAILNGEYPELDKVLGVAGRGRLHAHGIYEDVDWDDGRHGKVRNEDHRFIALRQKGTDKEK